MKSPIRLRAAALVTAGALAGGVTAASLTAQADDTTPSNGSSSGSSTTAPAAPGDGDGPGRHGGPGGPGRGGPGADAATLAKELGVTEAKVTAALEKVRDQLRPSGQKPSTDGQKPTPPTDAERAQRQAALAKALASELGVSEAKVTAALEKARTAHQAEHRTELSTRLDQAVTDGKISAADKASVLKAFDAGVLGPR